MFSDTLSRREIPDPPSLLRRAADRKRTGVIYTVSVGANRFLTLQNQVGLLNEATVEVKHGSVYSMSRESQSTWKHGMLPQDSTEPRISFGF